MLQSCKSPQPKSSIGSGLQDANSRAAAADYPMTPDQRSLKTKFGQDILSRIFSKTKMYSHTVDSCSDGITVPVSYLDVLDDSTKNKIVKIYEGKSDLKLEGEHRGLTTGLLVNVSATITHFKVDANYLHRDLPKNSLIDQMKAFDSSNSENYKFQAIKSPKPERRSLLCHLSTLSKGIRGGGCPRPSELRSQVPLAPLAVIDDADDDTVTLPAWLFKELKIRVGDPVCISIDLRQKLVEVQRELLTQGYRMKGLCLRPLQTNYIEIGMVEGLKDRQDDLDGKEAATSDDTEEGKEDALNTAASGQNLKPKNDETVIRGIQNAMSRYRVCKKGQILRFFANQKIYEFQIKDIQGFTEVEGGDQDSQRRPFYVNCGDHNLQLTLEIGEFGATKKQSQIEVSGDSVKSGASNVDKRNQRAQQQQRVEKTDEGIDLDLIMKERGLDIFYMEKVINQFNQTKEMAKKMQQEKKDKRNSMKARQSLTIKRQQTSVRKSKLIKRISFGEQSLHSKGSSVMRSQASLKSKSPTKAKDSVKVEIQNQNSRVSITSLQNQLSLNQPKEGESNILNVGVDAQNKLTSNSSRKGNGPVAENETNDKNGGEETEQLEDTIQEADDDGPQVPDSPQAAAPPIEEQQQELRQLGKSPQRSIFSQNMHPGIHGNSPDRHRNFVNRTTDPVSQDSMQQQVDRKSRTMTQIQKDHIQQHEAALLGESLVTRLRGLKENGLLESLNRTVLVQNNRRSPARSSSERRGSLKYAESRQYARDEASHLIAQKLNQVLLLGRSASQSAINDPERGEALAKMAKKNDQGFKEFEYELLQQQYFQEFGKSFEEVFKNDGFQDSQQHAEAIDRGNTTVDKSGSSEYRRILIERKVGEGGDRRAKNSIRVHMHHDQLKRGATENAAAANGSAAGSGAASGGVGSAEPVRRRTTTRTDTQPLNRQMNFDPSGGLARQFGADARHENAQKKHNQVAEYESTAQITNYADSLKLGKRSTTHNEFSAQAVGNNNQVPPTANGPSIWIPSKAPVHASLSTCSFIEKRNSQDRFGQQDEANLGQAGRDLESKLLDDPSSINNGQFSIVAKEGVQGPSHEEKNQAAHHYNVVIKKPPAQDTEKARGASDDPDQSKQDIPDPGADSQTCLVQTVGSPGSAVKIIKLKQRNAGEEHKYENNQNQRMITTMSNETSLRCPSLITSPVQSPKAAFEAFHGSGAITQCIYRTTRGQQGDESYRRRSAGKDDQPFLKSSSLLVTKSNGAASNTQMTHLLQKLASGQQRARQTPGPLASISKVRCGARQSSLHNYQGGTGASPGALDVPQKSRHQKVVNRALSKFSTQVIQTIVPKSSKDVQRKGLKVDKIEKDKYGHIEYVKKKITNEESATNILPFVCRAITINSSRRAGSAGMHEDSIVDKATMHQLGELLRHLAVLEREGRFQDGIGEGFRFELSKMMEAIVGYNADTGSVEKLKSLVYDLQRQLVKNMAKYREQYFEQRSSNDEEYLRSPRTPSPDRQVVNLQAIKSQDQRESAEFQNDGSYLHQSTPEISPQESAIAPQLGSGRGVAADDPQDKDSRNEGRPGLDSQQFVPDSPERLLVDKQKAQQAHQSDDATQDNVPQRPQTNDGNTNHGVDTLASKDVMNINVQNDDLRGDAAGSDPKQNHKAPKTMLSPASLRSEEEGSLASKKSNSQVIYSKKHITQVAKIQQSEGVQRRDGRHQTQEGLKRLPRDYLERLTRKEEEQQSLANTIKNYTIDHYMASFPSHDHPGNMSKKRSTAQNWDSYGDMQKNMLKIDTHIRSPAEAAPSNFFKQNADIKTALRQQSGKKSLDKGNINLQDHGELGTLDLASPHTEELMTSGMQEPRPVPEGAHRSPTNIFGSPTATQFLNSMQSPVQRSQDLSNIGIPFNFITQQHMQDKLYGGVDWDVLRGLQMLMQLDGDFFLPQEQAASNAGQASNNHRRPAQWLPIDQEYILQKQKEIAEKGADKGEMTRQALEARRVAKLWAKDNGALKGGETSNYGGPYSIYNHAFSAAADPFSTVPTPPSRPSPPTRIVGKRTRDLKTLCAGEYTLYNHHSPSIPYKLPPASQDRNTQAAVASPNKRGFFASLTSADYPLNMHISPSSRNAPTDLCTFANIGSSPGDPRYVNRQLGQEWKGAQPQVMRHLNQDIQQFKQMQQVYSYQGPPSRDQRAEALLSDPTNAEQILAKNLRYIDQDYNITAHILNNNYNSHSGQHTNNQDKPVSRATLHGNATMPMDKSAYVYSPTTAAMIHQRGVHDGDLSPVGGQANLILTHSSNDGESAHASHRRRSADKLGGNNDDYAANPSAGAVLMEDYRFSRNEAGSPNGKDSILLPDDGGSLKQVISMRSGVGSDHQSPAIVKPSHAHRRVVSGGQVRGATMTAGSGDRGASPRASPDSNVSKGSLASAGMSLTGVVYVQSSKLNFISEKEEDEEDRAPTKRTLPPSGRKDTAGTQRDSQGSLRRPPDSDPADTGRLTTPGKE